MRILFVLLFASTVSAQQREAPKAVWKTEPMEHWSCPKGMVPTSELVPVSILETPQCIAPARFTKGSYFYNADTQEAIHFAKTVIITNQGTVAIEWSPLFLRIPGCAITGDEKDHIDFGEQSKQRMVIIGKPGQELHLQCVGVVNR